MTHAPTYCTFTATGWKTNKNKEKNEHLHKILHDYASNVLHTHSTSKACHVLLSQIIDMHSHT